MPPANLRRILIVSGCIWAAGFVALKACGAFGAEMPPKHLRGPATVEVQTFPRDQIAEVCARETGIQNTASRWNEACAPLRAKVADGKLVWVRVVFLPNPCEVKGEWLAATLCHEIAHAAHGWSGAHEK